MRTFAGCGEQRANNFDLLRLLLAVLIIFDHSFALTDWSEPIDRFSRGMVNSGDLALAGFFIISGFLITKSWLSKPRLDQYLEKRALRIFPGYLVAAAVSIVFFAPLATGHAGGYQRQLLSQAMWMEPLQADAAFRDNALPNVINGSLWTIRYEFYCYLLVAFLGVIGLLKSQRFIGLFAVAAIALVAAQEHWWFLPSREIRGFGVPDQWPALLGSFAVGMGFYAYRNRIPRSPLLFLGCLGLLAILLRLGKHTPGLTLLPVLLGYAIFYLAFHTRWTIPHFARHGDFSYGVYLYAFPLQQLFALWFPSRGPMAMCAAVLPAALGLAFLSWHLVERPCLSLKKPLLAARQRAQITPVPELVGASM